jgi:chorismate--pyruvate lyase
VTLHQLQQTTFKLNTGIESHSISMPFNQGLTAHWQQSNDNDIDSILTPLCDWLFDIASLTKRLSKQCNQFDVYVISQDQYQLSQQERDLFSTHDITCREVLLLCDGVPQVYARTLIPKETLEHANEQLKSLGNTSLGEILFSDHSMRRSTIEVCNINEHSALHTMSQQLSLPLSTQIWGRRSMFYLQDYPLSVAEFFLPGAMAYHKALL